MAAALGLAANVIAVLQFTGATISACYNYGISVKNTSRDKQRILDQLFGLQKVLDSIRRLVEEDETAASSRLPSLNEQLLRCRDELQSLNTVLAKGLGGKGRMQALIWPLKESEVHKTLDKLGKLQDLLTTAMDVDQTRLTLKIDSGVVKIGSGVEALQARTAELGEAMEQAKLQEHRQKIDKWLAAPDHESKDRNARSMRREETGSWVLEEERFREWREAPHSFLWLHGIPGAGKTILCSTIIEELSLHCRSDPSLAIAFFYFGFNSSRKDTLSDAVLRSLLKQLSGQCTAIPNTLDILCSESVVANRSPAHGQLLSTLKSVIGHFRAVYIVFDALDECPERSTFLKVVKEIHAWRVDGLHLLATSRKEGDIERVLKGLVSHEVSMNESLVDPDIKVHISRTLEEDIEFSMCSEDEKEMVKTTLMNGAHGMFRWVVCQLDALRKCRSPAALERALTCLPKTLYETYDRILEAIDEDDRRDALSLLQWLAFLVGTLSPDEAVDVIATDADAKGGPLFDRRRRLHDPRDILSICSSLVTISVPGATSSDIEETDDNTQAGEIRLAHFSVKEYLISEHLGNSAAQVSYFHFNEQMAHAFIAKTCLAYLMQFDQANVISQSTISSYPLSRYAAKYWIFHAQSDPAGDNDLHELGMALLEPMGAIYVNWLRLYHQYAGSQEAEGSPLYYAAEAGLERVCQSLLNHGLEVDAPGGLYYTPLQVAAACGHDTIVELLLEKGAELGCALPAAAYNGHDMTVLLLLEEGADPNTIGPYGSALQAAASNGQDTTVLLLLEKGMDVNGQEEGGHGSALAAAAAHGHDTTVLLLLENGAEVNAHGGQYGYALEVAALWGHEMMVRLFLEKGTDMHAHGGKFGSALQAVAYNGHDTIVQLLLDMGADVKAQGGVYGGALQAAVVGGHDKLVSLLLEAAAAVPNGPNTVRPGMKLGAGWVVAFSKDVPHRQIEVDLFHTLAKRERSLVQCVCFSADGRYLATGCSGSVEIYETTTGARSWGAIASSFTWIIHIDGLLGTSILIDDTATPSLWITSVCFSPNGKLLATGAADYKIRIWDISDKPTLTIFEGHHRWLSSLDFSHDGSLIVSGSDDSTVRIWDMETGEHKMLSIMTPSDIDGRVSGVSSVAISPDGHLVAAGYYDATVRLWDIQTGQLLNHLMGHSSQILSVAFTPDGNGLISGSMSGEVKRWDLGLLLRTVQRGAPLKQSYEVDGEGVGSPAKEESGQNEGVYVWMVEFIGHTRGVRSVAVSHDNQWVVSGSYDRSVRFWDLRTGEAQLVLHGDRGYVKCVDLSPTGGMLATSYSDGSVRLWSYATLQ
ncbi:hypothetical protein JB92DRAFT_3008675 [Gautieria morchelliformis]|nr:hypothetical protein JB92DRAFT_3008675 [Gautieria morchelliformis]